MTRSKWFLHAGRPLEVGDQRVMTTLEVWIYEVETGRFSLDPSPALVAAG